MTDRFKRPMARSLHGELVERKLAQMPCGGTPVFDDGSGCAYRCDCCGAVIGSMGQSAQCKEINSKPRDPEHPGDEDE